MPGVFLAVVLIRRELLRGKLLLRQRIFVRSIGCLLFCCILGLVLQVKADRLLEVDLNSTALVLSL